MSKPAFGPIYYLIGDPSLTTTWSPWVMKYSTCSPVTYSIVGTVPWGISVSASLRTVTVTTTTFLNIPGTF